MGTQGKQHHQNQSTSRGKVSHFGLPVVLLIFGLLAAIHSIIVPITQGEDELAHYRYIAFIEQSSRLPATFAERQQAWYRADWPPLYHLLVAAAVSPLDTSKPYLKDVGESPHRRLVGKIFYPRLIIYTEDANWPWQDGILAWHIGRFISVFFAAAALIFVYLTALELGREAGKPESRAEKTSAPRPSRSPAPLPLNVSPPLFATAVTALPAFIPRFIFSSAMLGDDSLFILLSAIFIWLLLRALRGSDSWLVYAAMGLLPGLSIATKYSTGLLPLALIPVIWWRAKKTGWGWIQSLGRLLWSWFFVAAGAGWWFGWIGYHFNSIKEDGLFFGLLNPLLASGPDVSMRRVFAFFGGQDFSGALRPEAVAEGNFWNWLTYLFETFWGVPVLEADPLFPWAYAPLLLFCLLACVGLWQYWHIAGKETRRVLAVLMLIIGLLLPFPILRFFLTYNILETGQGRHILYPAAQSIPILLTLGWLQFGAVAQKRRGAGGARANTQYVIRNTQHASRLTLYLFLVPSVLLIWSIFQLIYMHRTYPEPLPVQTTTFEQTSIPQPLKHNLGDSIQFLGYDFQPDPEQAIINLTLTWKSLGPADENYRVRVQLVDPNGDPHFTWLSHPLNGLYPTRAWDAGDVIRDTLPLPLAAVPANAYDIQIDLVHEANLQPVTAKPFQIIHFDLGQAQPIANAAKFNDRFKYRLWVGDQPVRHRQTLPLSWTYSDANSIVNPKSKIVNPEWVLIGPDGVPRPPEITGDATAIFIVGADWPSGDYCLGMGVNDEGKMTNDESGVGGVEFKTGPLLTVAGDARLFNLPAEITAQPGWTPVEANFANQIELAGYALPTRRVEPGGSLPVSVIWRSLAPVQPDAITFAVLLDAGQQSLGSIDRYPSGYYSPMLWAKGEVVPDEFALPVHPDAPPGVYFIHLGQYQLIDETSRSLRLFHDGQPTDNTAVVIGPIKVGGPPADVVTQGVSPQIPINQSLGDQITLLGYDLNQGAGEPDANGQPTDSPNSLNSPGSLNITLYWQAEAGLTTDYTTFLHLRNAANQTVAQKDAPPAAGRYPTSLWDKGEIIVDEITLPLDRLPAGEYTPVVGLYKFASGARLPVPGNPANEITLEPVQINE